MEKYGLIFVFVTFFLSRMVCKSAEEAAAYTGFLTLVALVLYIVVRKVVGL